MLQQQSARGAKRLLALCGVVLVCSTAIAAQINSAEVPKTSDGVPLIVKADDSPLPTSNVRFVAPNGSNSNNGSEAQPWLTVAYAVTNAPAGSTIVFRGGTYRIASAIGVQKTLSFRSYPNEQVWIKGSEVLSGDATPQTITVTSGGTTTTRIVYRLNQPYTRELPLARTRVGCDTDNRNRGFIGDCLTTNDSIADRLESFFVDGRFLRQVASLNQVTEGTFFLDYANDALYFGTDPRGRFVEGILSGQAFVFLPGSANSKVTGLGFAHYFFLAHNVQVVNWELRDSTIVWGSFEGVGLFGAQDAKLIGNELSFHGHRVLQGNNSHRMVLENNRVRYNNLESFAIQWSASGVKLTRSNDVIWRKNYVESNAGFGMWIDVSCLRATLVGNTLIRNNPANIHFEISKGGIIADNVIVGGFLPNSHGILLSGSSDLKVYNNTIVDPADGIQIVDHNRTPDAHAVGLGLDWRTRNVDLKNNIISYSPRVQPVVAPNQRFFVRVSRYNETTNNEPMVSAMNDNDYHRGTFENPSTFIRWTPAPTGTNNVKTYSTRTDFTSDTGFETNGRLRTTADDPYFVNRNLGNLRLRADSEAKGTGEPLPTDVADAIGITPGAVVDRGALTFSVPTQAVFNTATAIILEFGGFRYNQRTGITSQTVTLRNTSTTAQTRDTHTLVVSNLPGGVTLQNRTGNTNLIEPVAAPYINFGVGDDGVLTPGEAVTVTLQYHNPANVGIDPLVRLFYGVGGR